jgi:hypothetical protein
MHVLRRGGHSDATNPHTNEHCSNDGDRDQYSWPCHGILLLFRSPG